MKLRALGQILFLAAAFTAIPAVAQPAAKAAKSTAETFQNTWATVFGYSCPAQEAARFAGLAPQETFQRMWEVCELYILPDDRRSAQEAMRLVVLGDAEPFRHALKRTIASGRLVPGDDEAVLWYALLLEEANDSSILPEALPPGRGGVRLRSAVVARGGEWPAFLDRMAAWVAQKAVASGDMAMEASSLPAVWVVDHDLPPGGFTAWRLAVPSWASVVRGEALGGAGAEKLRLVSVFAGEGGTPLSSGLGALAQIPILLPRKGDSLWLVLWNPPGDEPAGFGLTVTLWSDIAPPFQVREARLSGGACDLLLLETPGLAGYFWRMAGPDSGLPLAAPPFASEGEGLNRYHVFLNQSPSFGSKFELQALTVAGGETTVPLEVEPEPAP